MPSSDEVGTGGVPKQSETEQSIARETKELRIKRIPDLDRRFLFEVEETPGLYIFRSPICELTHIPRTRPRSAFNLLKFGRSHDRTRAPRNKAHRQVPIDAAN